MLVIILMIAQGNTALLAQQAIGEWQSYLPYKEGSQVADAGNRIYCGTMSGLYYFDRQFNTVNVLTKGDGLSDLKINAVNYSPDLDVLVIGYENTNIDILQENEIFNIPDIKRKQITANKIINNILILDELAYLSCGFGIVVINLEKKEIKDTYLIGENGGFTNVYDMAIDASKIYAATEAGIFQASRNSTNLVDFNSWTRILDVPHSNSMFSTICWYRDKLYAAYRNEENGDDTLYYKENGLWKIFPANVQNRVHHIRGSGNLLVTVTDVYATVYNAQHESVGIISSPAPVHAVVDGEAGLWVADRMNGMYRSTGWDQKELIAPNGPLSSNVASIALMDDVLYTAAGNVTSGWNNIFQHLEMNIRQQGIWSGVTTTEYRDLIHLSIDPSDKHHVYGASWGYGLVEFRDGEIVEVFDNTNSSLQTIIEGDKYFRLGGSAFDREGNLWMTNSAVPEPISVKKADGKWKSFTLDGVLNENYLGRIINTTYDHKWLVCPLGHGLFAFDVNGTIDDISDDRYKKFDIVDVNGKIISNYVYCLVEDRDGNHWIGTDKGIVVYYSPTRVFDEGPFYGQQIIVPRNDGTGLADILLGTEKVTSIAVDGANRKWIGTSKSGLYLVSDDGLEEVHHFTEENSPLLSNTISDIVINDENGLVFIGTDAGLISYKSTAIEGKEDFSGVYVYPNPVHYDYDGEIVITGLVGDVNVKITDITGNIVYETTALGGQAIWDGRSFSGDRVSTGVYMIFCTDDDGSKTHITKLLIIN